MNILVLIKFKSFVKKKKEILNVKFNKSNEIITIQQIPTLSELSKTQTNNNNIKIGKKFNSKDKKDSKLRKNKISSTKIYLVMSFNFLIGNLVVSMATILFLILGSNSKFYHLYCSVANLIIYFLAVRKYFYLLLF